MTVAGEMFDCVMNWIVGLFLIAATAGVMLLQVHP